MGELIFREHALTAMARDSVTVDDVYTVVGDADEITYQDDGRTRCDRFMEDGRYVVVVIEDDGETVVTAWQDARRSRRRR